MAAGGGSTLPSLIRLVDRYGEHIECDLLEVYGVDLREFFAGSRPWRQLAALVRGLPPRSRLNLAQADDDELAEQVLAFYGDKVPTAGVQLAEYGPVEQRLDRLTSSTEALLNLVSQALKAKVRLPPPPKTPRTALVRARAAAEERRRSVLDQEIAAAQARNN